MKFEGEEWNVPLHSFQKCSSVSTYLGIYLQTEENEKLGDPIRSIISMLFNTVLQYYYY